MKPDLTVRKGHLRMGGENPAGVEISANSRYLTLGGQPWLPVMGEFHYSRDPEAYWREELLKMKAGGIQIVATYIFWIHHEEIEGQVDWLGQCDLRRFIHLCAECGLLAYPRLGPWAHGEARNGGFPDWLLERCGRQVRGDFPLYLSYVRAWFGEISAQLRGLYWQDGGPIVGLQLENELADRPGHILTLKRMAQAAGMQAPLYTMTGWGPAEVPEGNEVIPVFGGYPDAPWERQVESWSRPARKHYFFHLLRDDNAIGSDLMKPRPDAHQPDLSAYPFACCEIGGGVMPTYHRRSSVSTDDVASLAMVKIGCGNNLQGYYMYHGGSNRMGQLSSLQESQTTGYWNDYPSISYDFQAPLGEYGQARPAYHALRRLHLFLADFGADLAPLPVTLPENSPVDVDDRTTLRWAVRSDGQKGYLFINNYQRVEALSGHKGVQFRLRLPTGELIVPRKPLDIPGGAYMIWPFNLELDGLRLKYATAQPVCRVQEGSVPCYVFSACPGIPVEFAFDQGEITSIEGAAFQKNSQDGTVIVSDLEPGMACSFILRVTGEETIRILVLSYEESLQCWKMVLWGQERIILSPANLFIDGDGLRIHSCQPSELGFAVYPPVDGNLCSADSVIDHEPAGVFRRYHLVVDDISVPLTLNKIKEADMPPPVKIGSQGVATPPDETAFDHAETWLVQLPGDAFEGAQEIYLKVNYVGDVARAYLGGNLAADDFYYGRAWEIGLRRFLPGVLENGLRLQFLPLRKDAPIYLPREYQPGFEKEAALTIKSITAVVEYERVVKLSV